MHIVYEARGSVACLFSAIENAVRTRTRRRRAKWEMSWLAYRVVTLQLDNNCSWPSNGHEVVPRYSHICFTVYALWMKNDGLFNYSSQWLACFSPNSILLRLSSDGIPRCDSFALRPKWTLLLPHVARCTVVKRIVYSDFTRIKFHLLVSLSHFLPTWTFLLHSLTIQQSDFRPT